MCDGYYGDLEFKEQMMYAQDVCNKVARSALELSVDNKRKLISLGIDVSDLNDFKREANSRLGDLETNVESNKDTLQAHGNTLQEYGKVQGGLIEDTQYLKEEIMTLKQKFNMQEQTVTNVDLLVKRNHDDHQGLVQRVSNVEARSDSRFEVHNDHDLDKDTGNIIHSSESGMVSPSPKANPFTSYHAPSKQASAAPRSANKRKCLEGAAGVTGKSPFSFDAATPKRSRAASGAPFLSGSAAFNIGSVPRSETKKGRGGLAMKMRRRLHSKA